MLDSLHIKNFRCFEDLTIESLGRVNLIVGKNSTGKSTLLEAIQLFAVAGNENTIQNILKERGDSYFYISEFKKHVNESIFCKKFIPINESSYLKIGNISNNDSLTISCESSESHLSPIRYLPILSSDYRPLKITSKRNGFDNDDAYPFSISPSFLHTEDALALLWDRVFMKYDNNILLTVLKTINSDIENIAFLPINIPDNHVIPNETPRLKRLGLVKIIKESEAIPLKNLGDGIMRLLQMFLNAIKAKDGFLLIDEFENGLHYSIQEEVWQKLFKLAKELNIQIFATTHSQDAIKTFCKVALASPEEGCLISLGKSAYGEDKGKIIAIVHNEADLQYILDTGMEVR